MPDSPERGAVHAFSEAGTTGLNQWGGHVQEEFLKNLHGRDGVRIYREMRDNDPVIGAIHHAIDHILRQVTWRTESATSSFEHQRDKQFLAECLDDLEHTWDEFVSEALTKLTFGWSFHEVVYRRRDTDQGSRYNDGRIGWRKMPIRAQETLFKWDIADNGDIHGMVQMAPPKLTQVTIPMRKGLLFRTTTHKNNPEGRSILRNAYRPWYFKKRFEEVEGIGIERDLAGLPVMWIPAELMSDAASDEDKAVYEAYKRLVVNVRRDEQEGIVLPLAYDENGKELYRFELLSTGGSRAMDTTKVIERYDQRIAMTAMADFILLGHEGSGSYGLSTSKTGMFRAALRAVVEEIATVLNRVEVPRLFALNGKATDKLPRIVPGEVDPPDLQELGNYIQKLVGAGMPLFPDEDLENYLRQAGKLPMKGEGNQSQPGAHLLGPGGGLKAPNAGPSGTRGFPTNGQFGRARL